MNWSKIRRRAALAFGLSALGAAAHATVLLDLINPPGGGPTPYSLAFVATTPQTTVSIGGYQVPTVEDVYDNEVLLNNAGPNLLGQTWSFTPAQYGSDASQYSDGTSTNELQFAGVSAGSYDIYSQTINTIVGDTYNVNFNFTNDSEAPSPSALLVTAGVAPEPATWGLMLLGFGLLGASLRTARHRTGALQLSRT